MDPDRTTTTGHSENVVIWRLFQSDNAEPTTMANETIYSMIYI